MKFFQFIKRFFRKKTVFASQILQKKGSKSNMFINSSGKLVYSDAHLNKNYIVIGVCEWSEFEKKFFQIDKSTIVIDVFVIL